MKRSPMTRLTRLLALAVASAAPVAAQRVLPAFQADELFRSTAFLAVVELTADEVPNAPGPAGVAPWTLSAAVVHRIQGNPLLTSVELEASTLVRPFASGGPLELGDNVLAFLVYEPGPGRWRLADPHYGLMRVSWKRAPASAPLGPRDATLAELRAALADPDPEVQIAALGTLAHFVDVQALPVARELSAAPSASVQAAALGMRLAVRDGTALDEVARVIESEGLLRDSEKERLAWSLTLASKQLSVARLGEILIHTTNAHLARVAAYVLAQTGDRSSLPALAAGLDRPDLETQFRCVKGLARLTSSSGPGYRAFMADPTPTVLAWKERARRRLRAR